MIIKSFVGGHEIKIFKDCIYNPETRKYSGGSLLISIPYSGRMLNVQTEQIEETLDFNGTVIPLKSKQVFVDVDPVPGKEECDYCIVSNMYAAACRDLDIDTSRLLTIGETVTDNDGNVIGCINLNKN